MKKQLLSSVLTISMSVAAFGQQWVNFPSGSTVEWVNINDLDVTGNQITVEALVSVHDMFSGQRNIISKHSGYLDCNYLLRPDLFAITTDTGLLIVSNPVTLCQDTVYHLAATYDGSIGKYYVNGILVASQSWTGNLAQNNLFTAIGNRYALLNEQFTGYIDELRIWNITRTDSELAANFYDLPNPTAQPGLMAYYKFDGNYTNVQGNINWDGSPTGTLLSLAINPNFYGVLSSSCSPVSGINESFSPAVEIYPNPCNGNFSVNLAELPSSTVHLIIYNLTGEIVFEKLITSVKTEINLSNYANGMYFVQLQNKGKSSFSKIIVSR